MEYVELHAHSAFSFLDGASLPDELAQRAAELGYTACALTDHDGVYGSMEFAQAAAAHGLRPIHGAEVTIRDRRDDPHPPRHLTLLVADEHGWGSLCRLLTRAHAHTRDSPRRQREAPWLLLDDLEDLSAGLFCLSGCATHGVRDEPTMRRLRNLFGPERLWVELQRPLLARDRTRNRGLTSLARRLGLRTVATGNVHAHTPMRALLQDAFVAVRTGQTLDGSEPSRRGNHRHVLTRPSAMAARFADHPEAVAETLRIAEQITFDLRSDLGYRYPGAECDDAPLELARACRHRLDERYPPGHPRRDQACARLDEELQIIEGLGLAGFFLLHRDLLELARDVALEVRGADSVRSVLPPGRGRGSSVSSIVCYLTGLSHVDPLVAELGLGRFLNDDLQSLPDIDLDFPRDIRAKLIPRIHDRYGREHSALVAAFPTYRARGAIRDLGKALGLPPGEIERVARGSEGWSSRTVATDIETALGKPITPRSRWDWLAKLADEAYGLPRHLSQHSGGMIVATRPLVDCVPLVPSAMEGRQMAHWDKDSCGDAGFLKIDLLGLGMLSCVERCVELIHARRGERIDLSRVPLDDGPTYDAIETGETTGVFQIESRAQMASLLRTRPRSLEELTVQVAIVRPGPIVGGAVNPYIERLQRLRTDPDFQVPYLHESLRTPLAETLGTIIFQDQVIEVAQAFAGFTAGQAESLRRAMSRKRSEAAIEAHHRAFVHGAQRCHPDVDEALAERVFAMVAGFAGFGFPKAHAAAFGLLAYQSTWLRVHYGPEFLCALLDEQPMGFYPPDSLVHEAQRRGIGVLAPDINESAVGCTVNAEGQVRIGLGYILGVRSDQVAALVQARRADGPFTSCEDLASRAGAGRAALAQLAWSGACDGLTDGDRRAVLWRLGVAAPGRELLQRIGGRQGSLGTQLALPLQAGPTPSLRSVGGWEAMLADYATTGLTTSDHPVALLREGLRAHHVVSAADLRALPHGTSVSVAGLTVARQRPGTAGGIVFLLLEDESGTINLVVRPEVYERDRLAIRTEPLLLARGRLERHPAAAGGINVLVTAVQALDAPSLAGPRPAVADVRRLSEAGPAHDRARPAAEGTDGAAADLGQAGGFRAVAPPVMSFAAGRRR